MQKNIDKSGKMSKMDPEMGAQTRSFFGRLASFFRARRPWEPKWLPSLPQEPPRPVQASISIDFWSILDDFLMIFCIMWATFYLVCFITFLVTSRFHFQISGHKFKCVGVVRRGPQGDKKVRRLAKQVCENGFLGTVAGLPEAIEILETSTPKCGDPDF